MKGAECCIVGMHRFIQSTYRVTIVVRDYVLWFFSSILLNCSAIPAQLYKQPKQKWADSRTTKVKSSKPSLRPWPPCTFHRPRKPSHGIRTEYSFPTSSFFFRLSTSRRFVQRRRNMLRRWVITVHIFFWVASDSPESWIDSLWLFCLEMVK